MKATATKFKNIDQYIDVFPKETRMLLQQMRDIITRSAPGAAETISYNMPAFTLKGNLVYFAGYKNHIGFYPGAAGIAAFMKEISAYKNAKGSVQFPIDKALPVSLISRIVKFRVKANLEKANKK